MKDLSERPGVVEIGRGPREKRGERRWGERKKDDINQIVVDAKQARNPARASEFQMDLCYFSVEISQADVECAWFKHLPAVLDVFPPLIDRLWRPRLTTFFSDDFEPWRVGYQEQLIRRRGLSGL